MRRSWGRKSAVAAAVGVALAIGCFVVHAVALDRIHAAATAALEERSGLVVTIEATSMSLSGVGLRQVSLDEPTGEFGAHFDDVWVDASPVWLAIDGGNAVRSVVITGGTLSANAEWRPQSTEEAPRVPAADSLPDESGPTLRLEAVRVDTRDAHGPLASATVRSLEWSAGHLVVDLREVTLAEQASTRFSIGEVRIEARAGQLQSLRAARVEIETTDADLVGPTLWERIAAIGQPTAPLTGGAAQSAATRDAGVQASGLALQEQSRISDSFEARLDDIRVRRRTPEGIADVVENLDISVSREHLGFRTRGEGVPMGGGALRWDLEVEPGELRAVGQVHLSQVSVAVFEPLLPSGIPLYRPEAARVTASLAIEGEGESLRARGSLDLQNLGVFSPRIAPEPIVGLELSLRGEATFFPASRRLELHELELASGRARLVTRGALEWTPEHYLVDLTATLPATPCDDAIAAIPADLLAEVAGFQLSGQIAGHLRVAFDSRNLDDTELVVRVADGCRFDAVPVVADLSRFDGEFVHRVLEPDGTEFEMLAGPGSDSWTPLPQISGFLLHAVIGHEDGGFLRHSGFSVSSIREALVRNLRAGRYVMGASTITMQLAKNVFLRREKTLARKVQEVLLTWWLETAWSKDRILELYLNVIEYGPHVYGIRNASRHYFGVEPADLSPAQAAYLASILPNPPAYHVHYDAGGLPATWQGRVARFLRTLGERGRFDSVAVEEGEAELPNFHFHRASEPPVTAPTYRGRTAPLPFEASDVEADWDESMDGSLEADARLPQEDAEP